MDVPSNIINGLSIVGKTQINKPNRLAAPNGVPAYQGHKLGECNHPITETE